MPLPGGISELRSTRPNFIPILATRCLYWGVCLTNGQSNPKADQMSSWPDIVLLLATRCLYQGVHLTKGWPNVKLTWHSTSLGHEMPLLGVYLTKSQPDLKADQMSSWPDVVWLLTTRCLFPGGPSDLSAKWTSETLNKLCVLGIASQRSFLWKTNKRPGPYYPHIVKA